MAKTRYKDLDLSFQKHPVTGDISMVTDDAAIRQSIKNIVLTEFYDVPFEPNFGSGVPSLLFEPATPVTQVLLEQHLQTTLKNFEPRIDVIKISVLTNMGGQSYDVTLQYRIRNESDVRQIKIPLERVR